jgi:molybdenum cofactor cytidylyltransferase
VIVGVLLAAGAGSRFGGDKLLASLPDGTPIGVRAARTLRGGVDRGVAVVRPGDLLLARLLEGEGFDVVPFPDATEGMGASLAFGVLSSHGAGGWLVALADMPSILPATVQGIARRVRDGAWIAAPSYMGRRGHPVGFSPLLYPELTRLGGDEGARSILALHASRIETLECDDPGVLLDVDTISDMVSV